MFLAVDIGNTQTVLGLYDNDDLLAFWRLETSDRTTSDEYAARLQGLLSLMDRRLFDIDAMAIASVVPALTNIWNRMANAYLHISPLIVRAEEIRDVKIKMDNPAEVGADRIVNAIAAFAEYKSPLIVVDLGTATTFDCVDANGDYLGGVIAPGISTSMKALFNKASKLTNIPWVVPPSVLGKNTAECLQAGIFYGFAGQIDGVVENLKKAMGGGDITVIATGGFSAMINQTCCTIDHVDKELTIKGLHLLWKRSQKN